MGGRLRARYRAAQLLTPILVYSDPNIDLLPDMAAAEKRRRQATAHEQIAQAVVAARDICNPYRAAEAHHEPRKAARPACAGSRCALLASVKPHRNGASASLTIGPRQEIVEAALWMAVGDAGNHVGEVTVRLDPEELACFDQRSVSDALTASAGRLDGSVSAAAALVFVT